MAVADEIRQQLQSDATNYALAIQTKQVSSADARAGAVWPTERKTPAKPAATRSTVSSADTGDISSDTGYLDVGNSQYIMMDVEFSVASAVASIALALFDAADAFLGVTEQVYFTADSSWKNGGSLYTSARYVFDVSGASRVYPRIKSITTGNVTIFLLKL